MFAGAMVQHKIGFWVFLLLVALGAGWVANQEGRWPLSGWFGPHGEQDGQQEAEALVQPTAEAEEAPGAVTEQAPQEPEAEHAANAPPAREPAAGQSVASPSGAASPAPAGSTAPGTASNVIADDPTGANDQVAADDQTGTGGPAATQETAPAGSATETAAAENPRVENPPATTASALAEATIAVPGAEGTADQPTDSDTAAIPPTREPPTREVPAASTKDAQVVLQATADVIGDQDVPPGTEPGSATQPSVGSGVEVAALAPSDGQEPGPRGDGAEAAAAGSDPAREVAALLSDSKASDPPSFDIVRVEPDGRAVIAGRAAPGAEVELRSGDEVIDRVRASRRGDWVAIPGKPLSPGDQKLTVAAVHGGAPAVESQQMVVVAVPERASPVATQANVATPQPMAVLLPRTGRGTGRILQAPGRLSAAGSLALMTVGYDRLGQMLLSGEAPPGVPVRVYVDNQPVALVVGDASGTWSSGLDRALAPGTYTLRLDQLDAEGGTVARIETPIIRVSEPPIEGELQVDYVVVQPGNSLWRIARRLTGKGVDYVYIYDSNQTQIRDPDLIYPGQVFQIPAAVGSPG